MDWLARSLGSSLGKKAMMALTGLSFCGFLAAHLAGNLFIYGGRDSFNAYAEHLHSLGPLLTIAEIVLLTFALIHIGTGLILFFQNQKARPVGYHVNKSAGGRTIGSATMPYTGFFLMLFIIFHLFNFHFVDKTERSIFDIVAESFQDPIYVLLYVTSMVVAAVHVSHGFWSAFQTIGINHPKYTPLIRFLSVAFSLVIAAGFGFIPVYVSLIV